MWGLMMAKTTNYETPLKPFDICGHAKSQVESLHVQYKKKQNMLWSGMDGRKKKIWDGYCDT